MRGWKARLSSGFKAERGRKGGRAEGNECLKGGREGWRAIDPEGREEGGPGLRLLWVSLTRCRGLEVTNRAPWALGPGRYRPSPGPWAMDGTALALGPRRYRPHPTQALGPGRYRPRPGPWALDGTALILALGPGRYRSSPSTTTSQPLPTLRTTLPCP